MAFISVPIELVCLLFVRLPSPWLFPASPMHPSHRLLSHNRIVTLSYRLFIFVPTLLSVLALFPPPNVD
ncbi:hypothetical protein CPB83DRAFT_862921 [Crepidotus variabilis]|uniref:Uncharacterized protein n=1 Tax=Crepidotus variabilis TaxID=179855 RepID=A0A9P6E6C5_9AGAR|nr:hypothetical protein CPB83DRAFT_862921 [Crepidotus variabilis]